MTVQHEEHLALRHPTITFWRSPDILQVGVGPSAVFLNHVPASVADAVELLNTPHTRSEIAARLPHLDTAWLDWLYAHLGSAGLLRTPEKQQPSTIKLFGRGPLAKCLATALSDVGILSSLCPDRAPDLDSGIGLAILADRTAEPDRVLTNRLVAQGIPHLVVRIEPHRALVGPFVDPGCTPCVHCDDLTRSQTDHNWARTLAELCRHDIRPDNGLAQWAAATAVAQVRAWRAGTTPELAGSCLQLDLDDSRLRYRQWAAHPDCWCRSVSFGHLGTLSR